MKRLFKLFKRLFVKKCQCIDCYGQENKHSYDCEYMLDMCDEPLHNHHDGCPECDMPLEHLYTNKNETVYTCYECDTFDLRDDSGEYPDNHWTNTERGY